MYYYLALAVIGYYGYNKYKRDVDMLIIGGTFKLVKIYHVLKDYCGVNTEEKKEEIVEEVKKYLYIKDGEIKEMNKNDSPKKEELDFIVVEEKDRIRVVEPTISIVELKTINIKKPGKLFLQVIYSPDEGDEIDINRNLKLFYVLNNKILGYKIQQLV